LLFRSYSPHRSALLLVQVLKKLLLKPQLKQPMPLVKLVPLLKPLPTLLVKLPALLLKQPTLLQLQPAKPLLLQLTLLPALQLKPLTKLVKLLLPLVPLQKKQKQLLNNSLLR
jgi:hypothetical protein